MTRSLQKTQTSSSPNKNPDIRSAIEPKRVSNPQIGSANGTHEEGKIYHERSQRNDDVDIPGREIGEKISTGVKIVGAVTGVAGIVAGSATVVAVGVAAIGGALVYDQIRKG